MSLHDDVWDCVAHELCAAALHAARRNAGYELQLMCNLAALCALAATDRSIRAVLLPRLAAVKVDATRSLVDALHQRCKEPVIVTAEGRWRGQDVVVPHVTSVRGANSASIVLPVDLLHRFPLLRLSNSAVSWCNADDPSDSVAAWMTRMGQPELREVRVCPTARLVARAETLARVPLEFHCVVHIHVIRTYMSAVASDVFEHHSCLSFARIAVPSP